MRRYAIPAAFVLGLLLVGYAVFFWSDDEDLIREKLEELATAVTVNKESNINPGIRGVHLKSEFSEIFTPEVTVSIPEMQDSGALASGQLAAFAAQVGGRFETATVSYGAIEIQLLGDRAHVDTTATLHAVEYGGNPRRDTRDLDFELIRTDDGWRIEQLAVGEAQSGTLF